MKEYIYVCLACGTGDSWTFNAWVDQILFVSCEKVIVHYFHRKHWRNEDNYIMSCLQNWLFWVYYARVVQILSVSCEQIKHCTLLLQNTLKEYNCIMSCLWNWRFLEVQCLSWPNTLSFMWTDSTLYISFTECTDILMNTGIQLNPNQCKPLFKLN